MTAISQKTTHVRERYGCWTCAFKNTTSFTNYLPDKNFFTKIIKRWTDALIVI